MTTASLPFRDLIEHQASRKSSISSVLSQCGEYPRSVRIPRESYTQQFGEVGSSQSRNVVSPRRSASLARHRRRREQQKEEENGQNVPRSATSRRSHCLPVSTQPTCVDGSSGQHLSAQSCDVRDSFSKESGGRKIFNFFQRGFNTKRPKSVTKLNRKKVSNGYSGSQDSLGSLFNEYQCEASPSDALTLLARQISILPDRLLSESPHQLDASLRQRETITPPSSAHVYPIDSSMLNASKHHCFQVISNHRLTPSTPLPSKSATHVSLGRAVRSVSDMSHVACEPNEASTAQTHTYGCCSTAERNRWMLHLKRLMCPTRDAERRRENCLHVWVQEAKGLTGRHKYHCEILLDGTPCARTTSKRLTDMLFWGEEFDLSGLPDFGTLSVELWIDPESLDDTSSSKVNRQRTTPSQTSALRQVNDAPQIRKAAMTCTHGVDSRLQEKGCLMNDDTGFSTSETEHAMCAHRSKTSSPVAKSCTGMTIRKANARRERGKGEKRSTDSSLIATVVIPKASLLTAMEVENWYPVSHQENGLSRKRSDHADLWSGKGRSAKKEPTSPNESHKSIQLRIKTRYRSVVVLPLVSYSRLQSQLAQFQPPHSTNTSDESSQTDTALFLSNLDPWLSVKAKAELAGSIVALQQALRQTTDFLAVLILHEVYKQADPNMVLRGNSIATKATEIYLRLVGETYLPIILSDFVHTVIGGVREANDTSEQIPVKTARHLRHTAPVVPSNVSNMDCEVDTTRVQNSTQLATNQTNLLRLVQMVWEKIMTSEPHFPNQLRLLFATVRKHLDVTFPNDSAGKQSATSTPHASMAEHVISACLFLRYICPAILSPSLFGLAPEFPSNPKVLRAFTLVAKAIQSLANFSLFSGTKEVYMTFMNQFVMEQLPSMRQFLRAISTPKPVLPRNIHSPDDSAVQKDPHRLLNSQSHHGGFGSTEGENLEHQSLLTRSTSGLSSTPSPLYSTSQDTYGNGDVFENKRFREPIILPPLPTNPPLLNDDFPSGDHIDLALCLALCHCQLSEALSKIPADKMIPLGSTLKPILEEIDFFLVSGVEPNPNWWHSSRQSSTGEKQSIANESKNNAPERYSTSPSSNKSTKNQYEVHSRLTESIHTDHRDLWKPDSNFMPQAEPVETPADGHRERGAIDLSKEEDEGFWTQPAAISQNSAVYQIKYVQKPIPTKANQLTIPTVTNQENMDLKEGELRSMPASLLPSKMLPVRNTPLSKGNIQYTVPPYILPPVYLNRENPKRVKGQAYQTMEKGVLRLPTSTQTPQEGVLWSTDNEWGQSLKNPTEYAHRKQSGKVNKVQRATNTHTNQVCTTLANSYSHQECGINETSSHVIPKVTSTENGTGSKNYLYSDFPRTENSAMNNPLYGFHVKTNEPLASYHPESVPGSPSREGENKSNGFVQAAPSRSKSFTDQHTPRRHTYVNLNGNTAPTEALLSSIRDERRKYTEKIYYPLVDSHGQNNHCNTLETSVVHCPVSEAVNISSISLDERTGSVSSGSSHRTTVTLEGYDSRPHFGVSEATGSMEHDTSERFILLQNELQPTNTANIQRELDASHARLAEAQARLLANEAERIQLLRVWHNELMRQSQLTGYASWGPSTQVARQTLSQLTDQMNAPGTLAASSAEPSLRAAVSPALSTTASYPTSRIHRSMYSTKPRMGASVISATYQETSDVDQLTLPRGHVSNTKHQTPWTEDQYTSDLRVVMARSPSSPGLLSGDGGTITKTRNIEFNGDQPSPDAQSRIPAHPSQDHISQHQSQ